jgi:hypothetical protein
MFVDVYIKDVQIRVNAHKDILRIYFASEKDMSNLVSALQAALAEEV